MFEHPSTRAVASHRARDLVLVTCAVWLLVQNSLLAAWLTSQHAEPLFVVARALIRVGIHLAGQFWMLPAAALLGVALALSTGERQDAERAPREITHARL